jgi:prepilin signal peptidase PulO-like enzyme (type II secretory pathway)
MWMLVPLALLGVALGWFAAGFQHLLYRQPEFQASPARGRKLLFLRLFVAISFAAVVTLALRPGHYAAGPAILTAGFGLLLVVASSTDFERRIIPNRITYPAIVAATAFAWAWPDRTIAEIAIGGGVALAIAVVLFLFGVLFGGAVGSSASAFGLGDVKLIVLLGLLAGWPAILSALFIGVLAAGVPSLVMLLSGKGREVFSYGPYLALGGLVVLLFPDRFV